MSSKFDSFKQSNTSQHSFGPGDAMLSLAAKPPIGECIPCVHLMGLWHDKTKFGPLVYLSSLLSFNSAQSFPKAHARMPTQLRRPTLLSPCSLPKAPSERYSPTV